ncbi:MAG TPA: hypothetical protein VIY66_15290 [Candidatus Acidoferrales bacterium]
MSFKPKFFGAVVAVGALLAAPVWATSNSTHRDSAAFDAAQATTIGNTQLQPGHYTFEAREDQSQLNVIKNGKVIASVPCHWVQLQKKANNSEILSNNNQVNEVRFGGRTEAAQVG